MINACDLRYCDNFHMAIVQHEQWCALHNTSHMMFTMDERVQPITYDKINIMDRLFETEKDCKWFLWMDADI